MEPSTKRVRIEEPVRTDSAKLKPAQVTQTSNIFGPMATTTSEDGDLSDGDLSNDEIEADSDASGDSDSEAGDEDDNFDADDDVDDANDEADDDDEDSQTEHAPGTKKRKKTDPADFALAMKKILSSGLTTSNRKNPILARSLESKKLDEAAEDERLESKVRRQLTAEKRAKLERNHNTAVVGGETDEEIARAIEKERGMRKVAQRGVVRLFNAIRAAQSSARDGEAGTGGLGAADTAARTRGAPERDERTGLVVRQGAGVKKRESKAQASSKSSFLEMIKSGGRKA